MSSGGIESLGRAIGPMLALLLGAALVLLGGMMLLSAFQASKASAYVQRWGASGEQPGPAAFEQAEHHAARALWLFPGPDGRLLEQAGQIQAWRDPFSAPTHAPSEVTQARRRAIDFHEQAVVARPLWPYARLKLAAALIRAGRSPAHWSAQLVRAFELGGWRPAVNRRVLALGLPRWGRLSGEARRVVLTSARRLISLGGGNARYVERLASRTGMNGALEAIMPGRFGG